MHGGTGLGAAEKIVGEKNFCLDVLDYVMRVLARKIKLRCTIQKGRLMGKKSLVP
jgi:hypothetical protein